MTGRTVTRERRRTVRLGDTGLTDGLLADTWLMLDVETPLERLLDEARPHLRSDAALSLAGRKPSTSRVGNPPSDFVVVARRDCVRHDPLLVNVGFEGAMILGGHGSGQMRSFEAAT